MRREALHRFRLSATGKFELGSFPDYRRRSNGAYGRPSVRIWDRHCQREGRDEHEPRHDEDPQRAGVLCRGDARWPLRRPSRCQQRADHWRYDIITREPPVADGRVKEDPVGEAEMRELLVSAMKSRAMFYYAFYKEFSAEFGAAKTEEVMKRATYKRGLEIGKRFARFAPNDMAGLK